MMGKNRYLATNTNINTAGVSNGNGPEDEKPAGTSGSGGPWATSFSVDALRTILLGEDQLSHVLEFAGDEFVEVDSR